MSHDSHPQMLEADKLLSAGQLQQAQNIYLSIIQTHPQLADAYFKLAWIADKEGKALSAKKYLQKAYDKKPDKNYLNALCTLLSKTGRQDEALTLCKGYLQKNNKQDDVYFLYASLNIAKNQFEEAISALKASINLNPGKLAYYMKLGELFFHLGRFKDALELYKSAYQKGLQSEGLFLNLAKLYIDFGQPEAARDVLSRGMIFYPRTLSFPYRLQSIDKGALKDDFYASLKSKESTLDANNRFYGYWLLAQQENQKGDCEKEMQYLLEAHKAFKQNAAFKVSTDQFLGIMQQLNKNSEVIAESEFSPLSETVEPIFIVGIPRCGSTLLENIIYSGPTEVPRGEETGVIFHCAANSPQITDEAQWSALKQLCQQHYKRLGLDDSDQHFTDKSLENLFMIGLILTLYPKAKIVYCQRNPLACIVSILRNNLAVLPWAHDLESIFNYVDLCLKVADSAREKYGDRILTLNYEDLVKQPVQTSKQLMEFCQLPWDESCLSAELRQETYSKTASHQQIRKEINTDSIELYRAYQSIFDGFEQRYTWVNKK